MTFIPHQATRRELLLASGALFAWAYVPRLALAEDRDPRLLVIVLRGALDGLAAVAPVGDPDWQRLRGNDALTIQGADATLPLDGFFALNAAMPNLHRLYKSQQATIVHAVATPYRERSHFDGQDVLESGLTRPGSTESGWLNRALVNLPSAGRVNPNNAFAVGPITPLVARRCHSRSVLDTVATAARQQRHNEPTARSLPSQRPCSGACIRRARRVERDRPDRGYGFNTCEKSGQTWRSYPSLFHRSRLRRGQVYGTDRWPSRGGARFRWLGYAR